MILQLLLWFPMEIFVRTPAFNSRYYVTKIEQVVFVEIDEIKNG